MSAFKQLLDKKFTIVEAKNSDPLLDAKADGIVTEKPSKEKVEPKLSDFVSVDYNKLVDLLKLITNSNTLSDESNAKIGEYLSSLEVDRLAISAEDNLQEMVADATKNIYEATVAATKSAQGKFSAFANSLYGSVNMLQRTVGIDSFYVDAIHKQQTFVPVVNMFTIFLKNILSSADKGKFLSTIQNGQPLNPLILAKYMFTVPAIVTVDGKPTNMHVPFTQEFIDNKVSVKLPDYCYKIRPFLNAGTFAYDEQTGVKITSGLKSPFVSQLINVIMPPALASDVVDNSIKADTNSDGKVDSKDTANDVATDVADANVKVESKTISSSVIGAFKELLGSGIIGEFNLNESAQDLSSPNLKYLRDNITKIVKSLEIHEGKIAEVNKLRSELTNETDLLVRRGNGEDNRLTKDLRESILSIIDAEEALHVEILANSKLIAEVIKELP